MKLSVVIPCLDAAATIRRQLEALAAQEWSGEWEVIVADNGSTDRSLDIVREFAGRLPGLRIVDASDRRGSGHALNVGARAATGDALLFCDADDEVGAGYLRGMAEALSRHDFVACRIDVDKLNPPWLRWMRPQQDGIQPYRYPPHLPHAGAGTLGIKRALFLAVGGFDESLPYVHDADLSWRVQLAGTPLVFAPGAVIHMRMRDSLGGLIRQARAWGRYNTILQMRYGAPARPVPFRAEAAAWKQLLLELPRVRGRAGWSRWLWRAAWRVGRAQAWAAGRPPGPTSAARGSPEVGR